MQAIRDQQALNKQENERKREEAMKKAADIEDQQHQEDLKRTAESNVRKPPVASFRPAVPTAAKPVEAEIGSSHTKESALVAALRMSRRHVWEISQSPIDF